MSELADVTDASLSRLSHLIKRLEVRGPVRREPDPADGRYTNANALEGVRVGPADVGPPGGGGPPELAGWALAE